MASHVCWTSLARVLAVISPPQGSWFVDMHGGFGRLESTSGRRAAAILVVLLPSVLIGSYSFLRGLRTYQACLG
jgi:hypothetical protein